MKNINAFILGAAATAMFGFIGGIVISVVVYFAIKNRP